MRTRIHLIILLAFLWLGASAQNIPKPNIPAPQGLSVNSLTGNLFYQRNEQSLRGTGFRIYQSFYYNAAQDTLNYGYGKGWSFYYNIFYRENKDTVVIQHADAKKDVFLLKNGTYISPVGVFDVLTKNGAIYKLRSKDGQLQIFGDATHKKLTRMEDANGNYITIDYASGFPVNIKNSAGHNLSLVWVKNLLSEAKDNDNPDKKFSYAYNKDGDMVAVTDPMGGKKNYTYRSHFLTGLSDENGSPVGIDYVGGSGRVKQITSCSTEQRFTFLDSLYKTFVTQKASNGVITNGYFFDDKGRLTGVSDADNNKVEFTYDDKNNLLTISDLGKLRRYTYDDKGNILTETDVLGNIVVYTYDVSLNKPTSIKDKKGNATSLNYDLKGNLKSITKADGAVESYAYNTLGQKISYTNPNGNVTTFQYNSDGDLINTKYPIGSHQYGYNGSCCGIGSITDGDGYKLEMTYDLLGNIKTTKDANGNTTSYDYDAAGNRIKETDPNGSVKQYIYDGLNRLIGVSLKKGNWNYEYDGQSNLTKITDANGHTTNYTYNNQNLLSRETDPLGNSITYNYDINGNLIQRNDPNGNIINYQYDGLNRLIEKQYNGNTDKYQYDENSNLVGAYNDNIAYSFDYDAQNRIVKKNIETWGKSISYTYDAAGNRKTMTDQDGGKYTYNYDANNLLLSIKNPQGLTTSFEYNPGGRLKKQINGNGSFTTYHFNEVGYVDAIENWKNSTERISFFNYTFDKYGNRKTMTDKRGTTTYSYDNDNRLVNVVYPDGSKEEFKIDGTGNRTESLKNGESTLYSYDEADQLKASGSDSYIFDANGNTIQKNGKKRGVYRYDGENRLAEVLLNDQHKIVYKYDPFGNRIEKQDTLSQITKLLYDGDNLLSEIDATNKTTNSYTTALGMDIWLSMNSGGQNYFYNKDGGNSTTELTDINGTVVNQYQYDAFGNMLSQTGSLKNSILYAGRLFEREINLYDNRARFYNPVIGRFINKDIDYGDLQSPLSINKYSYVRNNPVNYVDPTGNNIFSDFGFGLGAVVVGSLGAAAGLELGALLVIKGVIGGVGGLVGTYLDRDKNNQSIACYMYNAGIGVATAYIPIGKAAKYVGLDKYEKGLEQIGKKIVQTTLSGFKYEVRRRGIQTGVGILAEPAVGAGISRGIEAIDDAYNKYNPCKKPDEPEKKGPDNKIPVPPGQGLPVKFPTLVPKDPNEIVGTAGYDTVRKWVAAKQTLQYQVLFENDPEFATAPAQRVTVYAPIDTNINPASLRLSDFGFGKFNFTVPQNTSVYSKRLDLKDSLGVYVDITAGLDINNRRAFWIFDSIDPATGLASTLSANKGFLPVNDSVSHAGEGYVNFTVIPAPGVKTLDTLTTNATIIFDDEQPITTNTWKNTIDAVAPVSKINTLTTDNNKITLNWQGKDDTNGTGIKSYSLYVSENDDTYHLQEAGITANSYVFTGSPGSHYAFFTTATDQVGNTEDLKKVPDISTINLKFTGITAIAANFNFTTNDTSKRVMFISATDTVGTPKPVNGGIYGANAAFGKGEQIGASGWYSVFNGQGNKGVVTGLTPGTTYRAMVITYTGNGGTQVYQPNPGTDNPVNFTTLASNADLNLLSISNGTLLPVFQPATVSYTASVGNNIASITVTPLAADLNAKITVNGTAVNNGSASADIPLVVGLNTITTIVTAQDGNTQKTYTVKVTRAQPLSSNASLASLVLSNGTLSPAFSSGTTSYSASVTNGINSVTVTPTATDKNATITVNNKRVASGSASTVIALNVGNNAITTVVTAPDSLTTQTYTINVNREAPAGGGGPVLASLALSNVTLIPGFNSNTTNYSAAVGNNIATTTVNYATTDANAIVTVNGVTYTGTSGNIPLNVGTNTITTVVRSPDANTKTYTVIITRDKPGGQTITFNKTTVMFGEPDFSPAVSTSGLPLAYVSRNSVLSIVDGKVHILKIGTGSIVASQPGDSNYQAATSVTQAITVTQGVQTVTFANLKKIYGDAPFVPATNSSGLALTFSSSDTTVAAIRSGQLYIKAAGTATISASQIGNANYAAVTTSAVLTVGKAPQIISFTKTTAGYGEPDFSPAVSTSGLPLTYVSRNSILSIVDGKVHILKIGAGSVIASQPGNSNYLAATSVTQAITVTQGVQIVTFANLKKVYGDAPFVPATNSSGLALTFSSSDTTVAAIRSGQLYIKAAGTATITASQIGNANYAAVTTSAVLTVSKAPQTISFTKTTAGYGEPDFSPAVSTSGLPLTYVSRNSVLSIVDGKVHILKIGAGSVIASQPGDANYQAATSVTQAITVTQGVQTVTFANLKKTYGDAPFIPATNSSGLALTFSSSDTTVAAIRSGQLYIKGAGTATITAIQAGNANYGAVTTSAVLTVGKAPQTISFTKTTAGYGDADFSPAVSTSGLPLTYVSRNSVLSIVDGKVHVLKIGAGSIVASQPGDANYQAATSITQAITVTQGVQTVTFANLKKIYGDAPFVPATNSSGLALTFSSSDTTVATIRSGQLYIKASGTATITASQIGNANYGAVTTSAALTVGKAPQTISFTKTTAGYGEPDFSPAVSTSGLPLTYVSRNSVLSIVDGKVHILKVGAGSVIASQPGDANYLAATSVTQAITITQGVQTVTFANLKKIYGDAPFVPATNSSGLALTLSSSDTTVAAIRSGQLYIKGAGTATVTASQAGNANYAAVTTSALLTISKAPQTIGFSKTTAAYGEPDFSPAVSTSGLPLTYVSRNSVLSIVDGKVHILKVGAGSVIASQPGDANYLAATNVTQAITVSQALAGNAQPIGETAAQTFNSTQVNGSVKKEPVVNKTLSPNGDGINDMLIIEGIEAYPDNRISIMDKNGIEVFSISNYDNINRVYTGKSGNNKRSQDPGTYFYVLEYNDNGARKRQTGFIVIRY